MLRVRGWTLWILASLWVGASHGAWADNGQARYWLDKGSELEARGEMAQALDCYERSIDADNDYRAAYQGAARLWVALEAFDRAIPRLERYTLRHPKEASSWYVLAYAYRRTGQWQHAVLAYESYVDLRPAEAAPYFGLAISRLELGDRPGARDAFARYLELERDPARARFVERARYEVQRLDRRAAGIGAEPRAQASTSPSSRAAESTTRALVSDQAGPDTGRDPVTQHMVYRYIERAEALLADGRVDAAFALASRISPADVQQATTLLFLSARVALARGHEEDARRALLALLAVVPTHMAAYRLLATLP